MRLPAFAPRLPARAPGWLVRMPVPADALGVAALLAAALGVVLVHGDYGIAWDDPVQRDYGHLLLAWYQSGFTDTRFLGLENLYYYGGAFDLMAALLEHVVPGDPWMLRHLWSAAIGVVGLVLVWRVARHLGGPPAGLCALALTITSPLLVGQAFVDVKDIPFAVAMLGTLAAALTIARQWPQPKLWPVVGLGLAFGLAVGTRVIGVVALGPLGLLVAAAVLARASTAGAGTALREAVGGVLRLLPAAAVATLVIAAVWPFAVMAPDHIAQTLAYFAHFDGGMEELFDGRIVDSLAMTRAYVPTLVVLQSTEVMLFAAVLALIEGLRRLVLGPLPRMREAAAIAAFAGAGLGPVLLALVTRPALYNAVRHFLFIWPPLIILAAVGAVALVRRLGPAPRAGVVVIGAGLLVLPVLEAVRLHPLEYMYYNRLAGGPDHAAERFPMDYWGLGLREAAPLVAERLAAAETPLRVHVCGNPPSLTAFLSPPALLTDNPYDADLVVTVAAHFCDAVAIGRPVASVMRDGIAIATVLDRRRPAPGTAFPVFRAPQPGTTRLVGLRDSANSR